MKPYVRRRRRHGEYGNQDLLSATVTNKTNKRYTAAVSEFANWVIENEDDAEDMEEFDDLVCDYIHELHRGSFGFSKASTLISALINKVPEFKHQLPRSKQALRGWTKQSPGGSYPPLTWELTVVIAMYFIKNGLFREGVGTLLAFDCMLRVGELTNIKRDDILDTGDLRVGGEHKGLVIRLTKTKTGPNKWVEVLQPEVQTILRQLIKSIPSSASQSQQRLFPFTGPQYRYQLKKACTALGFSNLYVPHSLRHGGATRYYHVLKMPIEDVLFRGRWASNDSARRYIQSGIAILMSFKSDKQREIGLKIVNEGILYHIALSQKHYHSNRPRIPGIGWNSSMAGGVIEPNH